jgi:hypothetical protein
MKQLIIVWRNPNFKRHPQRVRTLERGLRRTLYIVQQLMPSGKEGFWTTTASLELLRGGRVA